MTESQQPLEMRPLDEEKLREAFELFDADKDGEINADELQKVLLASHIFLSQVKSDEDVVVFTDHEPPRNISYRGGAKGDDPDG